MAMVQSAAAKQAQLRTDRDGAPCCHTGKTTEAHNKGMHVTFSGAVRCAMLPTNLSAQASSEQSFSSQICPQRDPLVSATGGVCIAVCDSCRHSEEVVGGRSHGVAVCAHWRAARSIPAGPCVTSLTRALKAPRYSPLTGSGLPLTIQALFLQSVGKTAWRSEAFLLTWLAVRPSCSDAPLRLELHHRGHLGSSHISPKQASAALSRACGMPWLRDDTPACVQHVCQHRP